MKRKMKTVLLSFVGATILVLGLQAQPVYASTYANRECRNYSYTWHYRSYRNTFKQVQSIPRPEVKPVPVPAPEVRPEPKPIPVPVPEVRPEPIPVPEPEVTPEAKPEVTPELNVPVSNFETRVVELTNIERAKQGLAPFKMDSNLSKVARAKSQDMQDQGYFSHQSPTYGSPFDMMKQFGISYRSAGENIAKGQSSPEQVVTAWMNSEGHRKNILGNYTHIGVGYVENGNVWTQMFISN